MKHFHINLKIDEKYVYLILSLKRVPNKIPVNIFYVVLSLTYEIDLCVIKWRISNLDQFEDNKKKFFSLIFDPHRSYRTAVSTIEHAHFRSHVRT